MERRRRGVKRVLISQSVRWKAASLFAFACFARVPQADAQIHRDAQFVVSANTGIQTTVNTRTDRVNFELFAETGNFAATQILGRTDVYDIGIAGRVWKRFRLGGVAAYTGHSSTATIDAEVPHPFFFEFPRTASGVSTKLGHREWAFHLQGQYWLPLGEKSILTLFVGPSVFNANQELVTSILTTERGFPFDIVNLATDTTEIVSITAMGFNLGFDLSYFGLKQLGVLGKSERLDHLGVAVTARYSRAAPGIELKGQFQPALELGGTQIAGGIRVVF